MTLSTERLREMLDALAPPVGAAVLRDNDLADVRSAIEMALSLRSPANGVGEADDEDWANDTGWNLGVNYAIERLCEILSVNSKAISWDAATETVNGDVMSVICNVLVAAYGDEWSGNERETATIRHALASPIEGRTVKVRELEWFSDDSDSWSAPSMLGPYTIFREGGAHIVEDRQGFISEHRTLEAAKSAAFEHYRAAIMAALEGQS